jgi:hypothetical protein
VSRKVAILLNSGRGLRSERRQHGMVEHNDLTTDRKAGSPPLIELVLYACPWGTAASFGRSISNDFQLVPNCCRKPTASHHRHIPGVISVFFDKGRNGSACVTDANLGAMA